jgi:hypothetical protein
VLPATTAQFPSGLTDLQEKTKNGIFFVARSEKLNPPRQRKHGACFSGIPGKRLAQGIGSIQSHQTGFMPVCPVWHTEGPYNMLSKLVIGAMTGYTLPKSRNDGVRLSKTKSSNSVCKISRASASLSFSHYLSLFLYLFVFPSFCQTI